MSKIPHPNGASLGRNLLLRGMLDCLRIPRGHRKIPRSAVHATAKQMARAKAKRHWQRQFQRDAD